MDYISIAEAAENGGSPVDASKSFVLKGESLA